MAKNTFARNVSTVFFPPIARYFASGDHKAAIDDIFLGVRLNAFVIIPLLAGLSLLSTPFIR
jgi:peptidoglycan biosynthesis protein MviN/MurJ (putative lipid II flippase)